MNQYLSCKLRNLSAMAIVLVIFIHMQYSEGADMKTLGFLQQFISGAVCTVAVPLFYAISGFLFFRVVNNGFSSILEKISKRFRTLAVPYLLANTLTFIFWITLGLVALKVGAINRVINTNILQTVQEQSVWDTLKLVYIDPPIAFQLWFIRDLLVAVVCSPMIWVVLRAVRGNRLMSGTLLFIMLIAYLFFGAQQFVAVFVFFIAGGCLAVGNFKLEKRFNNIASAGALMAIFLGLAALKALKLIPFLDSQLVIIFGIAAMWTSYDVAYSFSPHPQWVKRYVGYTFFVYLIHEPLLNIFKKLPLLASRSEVVMIGCYLLMPVVFYFCACWLGMLLKRIFPRAYALYTGGR